ncbi:subtilisin sub1 [Cystoisospora suis]|uniref:subtilisin n=1 Tax=Cystoisospora suis TaxID=483139 RepID=A0A2C6LBY6_9APIC|nr:subtilisin sub1 [Cystoisospora suis]
MIARWRQDDRAVCPKHRLSPTLQSDVAVAWRSSLLWSFNSFAIGAPGRDAVRPGRTGLTYRIWVVRTGDQEVKPQFTRYSPRFSSVLPVSFCRKSLRPRSVFAVVLCSTLYIVSCVLLCFSLLAGFFPCRPDGIYTVTALPLKRTWTENRIQPVSEGLRPRFQRNVDERSHSEGEQTRPGVYHVHSTAHGDLDASFGGIIRGEDPLTSGAPNADPADGGVGHTFSSTFEANVRRGDRDAWPKGRPVAERLPRLLRLASFHSTPTTATFLLHRSGTQDDPGSAGVTEPKSATPAEEQTLIQNESKTRIVARDGNLGGQQKKEHDVHRLTTAEIINSVQAAAHVIGQSVELLKEMKLKGLGHNKLANDVPADVDAIRPLTKDDELMQTLYEERKEGDASSTLTTVQGEPAAGMPSPEEALAEGEVMAKGAEEEAERAEDAAAIGAEMEDPGTLTPQLPHEQKPLRLLLIDDPESPISFLEGSESVSMLHRMASELDGDVEKLPEAGVSIVELPMSVTAEQLTNFLERLKDSGAFLEPDSVAMGQELPTLTDPLYSELWGVKALQLEGAWSLLQGAKTVRPVVCIIDTGVDYLHPDIKDNILVNEQELHGQPGVDDDGNGVIDDIYGADFSAGDGDPMDDHSHGTHVAGTIGAAANNNEGIVGVIWKPHLVPCKFLDANNKGRYSGAIRCINYCLQRGATVLNHSWAGGSRSESLYQAFLNAEKAGVFHIIAAGNQGVNLDEPANVMYPPAFSLELPSCLTVANLKWTVTRKGQQTLELAQTSNYGAKTVQVGAPGSWIQSTIPRTGDEAPDYGEKSGTSMAAPHITGLTALMLSVVPKLSFQSLYGIIFASVLPMETLDGRIVYPGIPDARKCVSEVLSLASKNEELLSSAGGDVVGSSQTTPGATASGRPPGDHPTTPPDSQPDTSSRLPPTGQPTTSPGSGSNASSGSPSTHTPATPGESHTTTLPGTPADQLTERPSTVPIKCAAKPEETLESEHLIPLKTAPYPAPPVQGKGFPEGSTEAKRQTPVYPAKKSDSPEQRHLRPQSSELQKQISRQKSSQQAAEPLSAFASAAGPVRATSTMLKPSGPQPKVGRASSTVTPPVAVTPPPPLKAPPAKVLPKAVASTAAK